MADIFMSQTSVRVQYGEASAAQINAATTPSLAYTLFAFRRDSSLLSIRNKTSAILDFYAVPRPAIGQPHDAAPPIVPDPVFLFRIDAQDGYNIDSTVAPIFSFPAGSQLKVVLSSQGASASAGEYLRVTAFG